MEIVENSFADLYAELRRRLLSQGELVSPKGEDTLELTNVSLVLTNPMSRLGYHPDRHFSLPFACAESTMLFDSTNAVRYLAYFNKRLMNFSDDGIILHGMYGHRIAQNISEIVNKLKKDPSSRQAVLQIYSASDLKVATKDTPCTIALQFLIRKGKLDLYTTMRSNDLYWGLPYDLFQFTMLQEIISNELDVDLGSYVHRATSMHVYTKRHEKMLSVVETLDPKEFTVTQRVKDMMDLADIIKYLRYIDDISILEKHSDIGFIVQQFEMKKRHIERKSLPSFMQWAAPFLEEM
ncbi:MAG TPA: thymidylate synthase [Cyclobacteriaceae bacterium]|jgi:thymidylate synthase|nr:thymidylate synthase [Cyclobacteriaceae bacterium]